MGGWLNGMAGFNDVIGSNDDDMMTLGDMVQ